MNEAILKKKADAFYKKFSAELGHEWELLTEYHGSHEPITARHIPCGDLRTAPAREFFRTGCRKCARAMRFAREVNNHGRRIIRQIEQEYNVTSVSEYKGHRAPHKWKCNACGNVIDRPVDYIVSRPAGNGGGIKCVCQEIEGTYQKRLIHLLKKRKRQLEVELNISAWREKERARMKAEINQLCTKYASNGYEVISIGEDLQHVTLKHIKCGRVYTATKDIMKRGHGCVACSRCGTSYGVQQIEKYLRDHHIEFEREVTFPTCKRERVLPFDFAVYEHGQLKCLIEFQGEQHYRASVIFGGEEKLVRVQEADAIKRQWARDNGINLVVIDWNEDIRGRMSAALE